MPGRALSSGLPRPPLDHKAPHSSSQSFITRQSISLPLPPVPIVNRLPGAVEFSFPSTSSSPPPCCASPPGACLTIHWRPIPHSVQPSRTSTAHRLALLSPRFSSTRIQPAATARSPPPRPSLPAVHVDRRFPPLDPSRLPWLKLEPIDRPADTHTHALWSSPTKAPGTRRPAHSTSRSRLSIAPRGLTRAVVDTVRIVELCRPTPVTSRSRPWLPSAPHLLPSQPRPAAMAWIIMDPLSMPSRPLTASPENPLRFRPLATRACVMDPSPPFASTFSKTIGHSPPTPTLSLHGLKPPTSSWLTGHAVTTSPRRVPHCPRGHLQSSPHSPPARTSRRLTVATPQR